MDVISHRILTKFCAGSIKVPQVDRGRFWACKSSYFSLTQKWGYLLDDHVAYAYLPLGYLPDLRRYGYLLAYRKMRHG